MKKDEIRELTVGTADIIKIEGSNWRVIDVRGSWIYMIRMDTPHTIERFEAEYTLKKLIGGEYEKVSGISRPPLTTELTAEEAETMQERVSAMEKLLDDTFPAWDRLTGHAVRNQQKREAAEALGVSSNFFNIMLVRYLCSGRNRFSLLDLRKYNHTGKTNEVRVSMGQKPIEHSETVDVENTYGGYTESEILEIGYGYYKENGRNAQAAYDRIIDEFYRHPVVEDGKAVNKLLPKDERLHYSKFYRFIRANEGKIMQARQGSLYARNNLRQLTGNSQSGINTIGERFMMDECEFDLYLTDSKTGNFVVGKGVVYIIIDAFSWMIVGAYIGFYNNSYAGFCNAFSSMLEPHENQTSRYGVHCSERVFPSMVIPKEMLVDLGAEYRSKALENIEQPFGMKLTYTPPGCASLKGPVESTHKRISSLILPQLINCGKITYGHGGPDKARKEACISLGAFREMVYNVIICLNQQTIPGYEPPLEMREAGIPLTPADIWAYECERCGSPVNMTNDMRLPLLFDLKQDDEKFKVTRNGIESSNYKLFYRTDEPWFNEMQRDHGENTEIRYDPDNVGNVYVRYKNEVHTVPFAKKHEELETYEGLTWKEYDVISKNDSEEQAEKEYDMKLKTQRRTRETAEIQKRLHMSGENDTKNIKENRRKELRSLRSDPEEDMARMEHEGLEEEQEPETYAEPEEEPEDEEDDYEPLDLMKLAEKYG